MSSYKSMIRDRMPLTLDLALRWCKAKNRWIDFVYEHHIRKYPKQKRGKIVMQLLGLSPFFRKEEIFDYFRYVMFMDVKKEDMLKIPKDKLYMSFWDTVSSSDVLRDADICEYWKAINSWVIWFKKNSSYIENDIHILQKTGKLDDEIVNTIQTRYKLPVNLVNYLFKTFK